ncbi:IS4 family transposase [Peptoclostridium sp. AF21-18]|uniref:IS4 family transposase n=1 Tax=Peptoclostridium sp. AF21-18 TaxID=2292243 RepID=UPI000E518CF1|nr:IS4 family transposase [Peptoclostridium sp. AF21-18]RHQ98062.1 IS4 family transposase [Peptoclostridium sp. AF21-18]
MKPKDIKKLLFSEINSVSKKSDDYCISSGKDFTRKRKLPFETVIKTIIGMESKSMTNELINIFDANPNMPSASAFVQQRCKIKPEAFKDIFNNFSSNLVNESDENLRILAVDGTDVQIATNPNDLSSFHQGINGRKGYNLIHLNALYDIKNHIYTDAVIQGKINYNEHRALQKMIDESNIKNALVIADRGYESYNNMAHIQEKGWYFLIRIKDGKNGIKAGLNLPKTNEFDEKINLKLSRRQTKQTKELFKAKNQYKFLPANSEFDYLKTKQRKHDPLEFYNLSFRIVRFKVMDNLYETVLTNLDSEEYPPEKLKELYASRWGIETSFRDLKYTIGMLNFHSKKVMCIHQEIYAHLIMYNFAEMITSHVVIEKKQRKYTYKANFSVATRMCRLFYHGKTTSPNLETIIARNIIPIRPDRHRERKLTVEVFHGFIYRVA